MTEQAKVPAIRFAGFTDPWEQRKLGELFEESDERASDREILSVSVANGIYPASESDRETNPGASLANYKIVHFGDVVYNSMRMWQGAVDASRYDGIVSPAYVVARPNSEVYARFFARLLRQPMLLKQYQQVSQGNSKDTQVLKFDDFASIGISMPASENEQRRIGGFFDRLDSLITLHQRKYDKLTKVKKAMLKKMFPQNGANKPEIRFRGFTDGWEHCKLNSIADVRDGTHASPQYFSSGHPFITSKNVKDGYINYDDVQYISDEDYEEINKRSKVDVNDILMGMIGTIGNLALIREEPDFAIKNVALIKDTGDIFYLYLYHYLQSETVLNQLLENMDGGTQKFVALKRIRELNIAFPIKSEQQAIGTYFHNLDSVITLHQRKCDKYKSIKAGLIRKLFP